MRLTRLAAAALGFTVLASAGVVSAQEQPWLKDRRYREGIGYRVGDLEVHPGVAGEFGYDSNFYLRGTKDGAPIVDVLRLRVTPSVSISTLSPQRREADGDAAARPKVNFRAGVAGIYNEYIAPKSEYRDQASKFRNLGALANFNLHILPERPFGAALYGDLIRTIQPSNVSDTSFAYTRINTVIGGELIWAPGGGLFDWRLGGRYDSTFFEADAFKGLNNSTAQVNTRGRWRFLPRTALMFDASQGFTRYGSRGNTQGYLLDSDPLRARVGLSGLITQSFGFLGMFGWGASFTHAGPTGIPAQNYDGPIGQLQLTFYPTPSPGLADSARETSLTLSQIGLGFTRDFANSYFGSFYTRDRGYGSVSYFFAGRVLVVLEAGVSRVHFPDLYYQSGGIRQSSFDEVRIDSSLFGEYRVTDSLGVNATVGYDQNASRTVPTDPTRTLFDDLSWRRFQGFVGFRWFM